MNVKVEKSKECNSKAVANSVDQKQSSSKPTFQFEDNRPEAVGQRKLSSKVIQRGQIMSKGTLPKRSATCTKIGSMHEDGKSFASVKSQAISLQKTDRVIYEISWDAAVAPVGHEGLDVKSGVGSDFIVDRSQTGESIGEDIRHYKHDEITGLYSFLYNDGIEWPTELNGGCWRFRLRVVNKNGIEVACSEVATIDWNH